MILIEIRVFEKMGESGYRTKSNNINAVSDTRSYVTSIPVLEVGLHDI